MAGLFFCLASAEGCRAFALLCCNVATHKRLQRVLCRLCSYTTNSAKQRTGLYRGVSYNLPHSTAANTRPTQAAIIPPAPRWSVSQRRSTSSAYQIPPPRRTPYRSAQTAYYNKVYKGATVRRLLWIHARRCSTSQTMPARRVLLLPPVDRWQVLTRYQQHKPGEPAEGSASPPIQGQSGTLHPAGQSSSGRRGTIDGSAVSLFGLSPDN